MSIKRTTAVWDQSHQSGTTLLVLLAIADNADDSGLAWPSIPTLAQRARCGERAVKSHIQKLERSGELRTVRRKGRHNFYIVTAGLEDAQIETTVARLNKMIKSGKRVKTSDRHDTGDPAITTTSDPPITTPVPSSDRQITTTSDLAITRSVNRTINDSDPSIESLAAPSGDGDGAPATLPPLDQPDSKSKKRSPRPRKDGTDPIPAALMNPMKDAIAAVFGWQWTGDHPMTDEEKGLIQKTARSLCHAKFPASDVPKLYAYCQARFTDFGPGALSKHVSAYRKTGGPNGRPQDHISLAARRPPAAQPGGNRAADAGRTEATPRSGHDPEWIAEQGRRQRERLRAKGYKVPDVP